MFTSDKRYSMKRNKMLFNIQWEEANEDKETKIYKMLFLGLEEAR